MGVDVATPPQHHPGIPESVYFPGRSWHDYEARDALGKLRVTRPEGT